MGQESTVSLDVLLGKKIIAVGRPEGTEDPNRFFVKGPWGQIIMVTGDMKVMVVVEVPPDVVKEG